MDEKNLKEKARKKAIVLIKEKNSNFKEFNLLSEIIKKDKEIYELWLDFWFEKLKIRYKDRNDVETLEKRIQFQILSHEANKYEIEFLGFEGIDNIVKAVENLDNIANKHISNTLKHSIRNTLREIYNLQNHKRQSFSFLENVFLDEIKSILEKENLLDYIAKFITDIKEMFISLKVELQEKELSLELPTKHHNIEIYKENGDLIFHVNLLSR